MDGEYIRRCPSCGRENTPSTMRCACSAILLGVDIVRKEAPRSTTQPPATEPSAIGSTPERTSDVAPSVAAPGNAAPIFCPHPDCGQPNRADATRCAYCNRPLSDGSDAPGRDAVDPLLRLPSALREDYRVLRVFPAVGAESDLVLMQPRSGTEPVVAKIYRLGIQPKRAVQERIERIDARYRPQRFQFGVSEGRAYEVMEYCPLGSLRELFGHGRPDSEGLLAIARELAAALVALHGVNLVHRDLKPENVMIRTRSPLELVLIDFGVASVVDTTQRFTGTARTLPYAAPESLSGVIDAKTDYWSMGMILLEGALGRHPFAGLSETVILHHLATQNVSVAEVTDRDLRKLTRGLLLRDPRTRWGNDEIERWFRRDTSLPDPIDEDLRSGFAEPYHLAAETCQNAEQLAIALARHWREGAADLRNGQLLAWFRDVQKDQNTVRLLLETEHEARLHVDVRLLKLLVHLAPGIPPVWRGQSVELPALLESANRALQGDDVASAWLDAVYDYKVLETYAEAGNGDIAEIAGRWSGRVEGFESSWREAMGLLKSGEGPADPKRIVRYDDVVYGQPDPDRPSLAWAHPRLLAMGYDPVWLAHLRRRLVVEFAALRIECPWLDRLGNPESADPSALLVLEAVLPKAKGSAAHASEARIARARAHADESESIAKEVASLQTRVRAIAAQRILTADTCTRLRQDLVRYFELLGQLLATEGNPPSDKDLRKQLKRLEPTATRLLAQTDRFNERRAANSGWFDARTLPFAGIALVVLPLALGTRALYAGLAVLVAIVGWRILPNLLTAREIRSLAARF